MKYINTDYDLIIEKTDENFPTYTVLHTFQCIENGKHYVILTDGSTDEAGMQNIYAGTFDPSKEEFDLFDLESDEEIEMVHDVLEKMLKESRG